MNSITRAGAAAFAGISIIAILSIGAGALFSQAVPSTPVLASGPSEISLRVRFGVKDTAPKSWDGSVSVSNGTILQLRNWRPRSGDQITGNSWVLSTKLGKWFKFREWEKDRLAPPPTYTLPPGLIVDVAGAGAELAFHTQGGNFTLRPEDIKPFQPVTALDGNVVIDRVPFSQRISSNDYQNDFATTVGGKNGEAWVAWIGYRQKGDLIFVRRFDGSVWGPVQQVIEKPADAFLVKLGRDRKGNLWAVWSAQVDHNFDLYARRFDGRSWSNIQRLTDDAEPDIYQNLATDSNGNLWVTWQGFRSGKSSIFVRRYDGSEWTPAERVSNSSANNWEPAIAADKHGTVYVAWDTYDKGNYDVEMRRFANGSWSDPQPVANTPKFEAHVSLACDSEDRLWAAWNESGFEWGKDTGFLVRKGGTQLYAGRWIAVSVFDGSRWREPLKSLDDSLAAYFTGNNDYPTLQTDPFGRVWVFFRHRTLNMPDTPANASAHLAAWEIYGTFYEGDHWAPPLAIPQSTGRDDMRSGFAASGNGRLYAAWPTDGRDFAKYLFQRADVYAASLPIPQSPPEAAQLRDRVVPTLKYTVVHRNEAEDVRRLRSFTIDGDGGTYHIYRGDMHRHTEFSNSDGNNDGSLTEAYRYALDAASLDFLAVTDHNGQGGPDIDYINWLLQKEADLFFLPGKFTPMFSYERSVRYPNGHRNVIFAERGNPTLPLPKAEASGQTGAAALYAYLKRFHGISIPHTSATDMGTDWRDNDPEVEPLVEIYQGDRISSEYEGAPKAANSDSLASAPGGFRPKGYIWNAWAKGYKLGVEASSDHLSTHISYSCILARDFTRQGLLDAMRQRHSYAATDNIVLDYRLESAGKTYLQGDIVNAPGDFRLKVHVIGTTPIRQIDVIRNNQFIYNLQPLQTDVSFTYRDQQPPSGESYYYVRVIQVNDQMAWSSPIWVER